MSPSSTKYGIAIMIPDPPGGAIRDTQKTCKLPPWQPKFDLHITLVPPFNTRKPKEEVIRTFGLAALRTPFSIRLAGIDRFDNAESILYVRVWPTDSLRRLRGELASAALAYRKPSTTEFTPHVTLTNPASRQTVDGYERCAAGKIGEYDFMCTGYSLLRLDETARAWKPVHEFKLSF